jgi:sodium/bile acid cotransporter 7
MSALARFRPDNFTMALVGTVIVASLLPCSGAFAQDWNIATQIAIALLFFLHGARLSRQSVIAGMTHWRLHATVFSFTYLLFPLLGLVVEMLPASILPPSLAFGIMFLCCLPSTVQSSIAFTSIAGGNIPAAICSASASSLLGVFLTPLLVGLLLSAHGGGVSLDSFEAIIMQLLVPFVVGQLLHPYIGAWALRHKKLLALVDRGSILMVVYGAFSEAIIHGLWHQLTPDAMIIMVLINMALLAFVLCATAWTSKRLGFNREDQITIVFCGSKKSLAAGVPMANILFAGHSVGMIVLPLMLFHQIQLMACAVLAKRYATQNERLHAEQPAE